MSHRSFLIQGLQVSEAASPYEQWCKELGGMDEKDLFRVVMQHPDGKSTMAFIHRNQIPELEKLMLKLHNERNQPPV